MNRLTNKNATLNYSEENAISLKSEKVGFKRLNFYTGNPIEKLAEYENTGLEPSEIEKLKHDLEVRDKALELAIKEIAILNNNNVCANKQCSDTNCDYYTETQQSLIIIQPLDFYK